MFSAEPFTFPPGGSPLLFQTGESYKGQPLIDRQHPHDLFMELSATYTVPVGERASWFVYAGYPGEPALGPNAFMHRASASENTSMQVSHGFLKNPEPLKPGDVRRTTASISYNRKFDRGNWASSLIWGP